MSQYRFSWKSVAATIVLAAVLWFATFYLQWGVFWFKISISALVLAALSLSLQPAIFRFTLNWRSICIGLFSAVLLYLIFWAGKAVSTAIFPFAADQVGAIYGKGEGTSTWIIVALLFFVIGPCEEIYWRGYLQRQLMVRFGGPAGWILATALYAGVHLWSGNFMLIGAAGVAGAFWGLMYWRFADISPVIISHAIWSTFIFAVMPVP
ncbi:MAG: CPBP family intramembrane metalloprotease [Desulfobacteraceae bacterium]|nr:CPBP family intramembrane metalloprotease [Desulfobacteraceae bacterium]